MVKGLFSRAAGKVRRTLAETCRRRELLVRTPMPLVSFSFDDAPQSAFEVGGRILREHGDAKGTYYVAMGLLGSDTEIGRMGGAEHLVRAVEGGHELGCHTFHHYDAWSTSRTSYLSSIEENQRAADASVPGYSFRTFAYPKNGATVWVKSALARRFVCCRGGGQSPNVGSIDLNLVKACFLDRRTGIDLDAVRALIDRNTEARGWLVFVAHDVSEGSGPFSCSTGLLEKVVRLALDSDAEILPVAAACARLISGKVGGRSSDGRPERVLHRAALDTRPR